MHVCVCVVIRNSSFLRQHSSVQLTLCVALTLVLLTRPLSEDSEVISESKRSIRLNLGYQVSKECYEV